MNWDAETWRIAFLWFGAFLISTTVHEASHSWIALLGGDKTAYHAGQVTLNPIAHIRREPFGMVILPIASLLMTDARMCFGYAHAPFDPIWAHHHPRRAAAMSAAGPVSNLLLAAIAFAVLWFVGRPANGTGEAVRQIAGVFLRLNLLLALFNLIPVPPLDGAGVVGGLSRGARDLFEKLTRIPYFGIIVFIALIKVLPYVYWPAFDEVNSWLPNPLPRYF